MKRTLALVAGCGLVALCATSARAADPVKGVAAAPQNVIYDADSAFEFLKTMAGAWERGGTTDHDHGDGSRAVTFAVTAAGSGVMETIYPGQPTEMISMYHRNGDELLMTHYCALQNAPILKFVKSDKPGEIKFEFQGGTNFDPKVDTHVHEGAFRVKDANTVESAFISFTDGKANPGRAAAMLKRKMASH